VGPDPLKSPSPKRRTTAGAAERSKRGQRQGLPAALIAVSTLWWLRNSPATTTGRPNQRSRGRLQDVPLSVVAHSVGYTSEFAFAKAFKREYGLAPGTYRRVTER
jgi:AraC-like DNA-binding protein